MGLKCHARNLMDYISGWFSHAFTSLQTYDSRTVHRGDGPIRPTVPPKAAPCNGGLDPYLINGSLGPPQVHITNGIDTAIFAGLTVITDKQTYQEIMLLNPSQQAESRECCDAAAYNYNNKSDCGWRKCKLRSLVMYLLFLCSFQCFNADDGKGGPKMLLGYPGLPEKAAVERNQ